MEPVVLNMAVASVATPETDAALRVRFMAEGLSAKLQGLPRDPGPLNGLVGAWWLEGYDGYPFPILPADEQITQ